MIKNIFFLFSLSVACYSQGHGSDASDGSRPVCEAGYKNCPCYMNSTCLSPLVCQNNLCVDLTQVSVKEKTCDDSSSCAPEEVCYHETCQDAWNNFVYNVKILEFNQIKCDSNSSLLNYGVTFDDLFLGQSAPASSCSASWKDDKSFKILPTEKKEKFHIIVNYINDVEKNPVALICWDYMNNIVEDCYPGKDECYCYSVPKSVLHKGYWQGYTYKSYINIEFKLEQ